MTMRPEEVSCRAILAVNSALQELGVSLDTVYSRLPLSLEYVSNSSHFVDWDTFVTFLDTAEQCMGGPEVLENFVPNVPQLTGNELIKTLIQRFTDPFWLYWAMPKWSKWLFRGNPAEMRMMPDGRIRMDFSIPSDRKGSLPYFRCWLNGLRGTPRALGLPDAVVDYELSPHHATYFITLPPRRAPWGRFKSVFRAYFAGRRAIEELTQKNDELVRYYDRLMSVERQLSEKKLKLELSAQLASLARLSAVGEMAGAISHEINNPLTQLNMRVERIKHHLGMLSLTDTERAPLIADLEGVESIVSRMSAITHGLLAFAGNGERATFERVHIDQIIQETIQLCRERLRADQVELRVAPSAPECMLECRPTQLSQVLLNLIHNAYDAVRDQRAPWISIQASCNGEQIEIRVTDSGPGISPASRQQIFEPFFTTKKPGHGTGLGLSISKGLVESHHGTLELDPSSPHTCFVIRIPMT